jgi:hypothetical protein
MKVENLQMRTLASLISEGKKVAFISGNRNVNSKNITSKKESFGRFECNIVPLMYVNGTKAVEDGCNLVDASTEQIVDANKVSSYIAIVDGQHRYTAAMEKGISPEFLILFEDYTGANTKDLLATANIDSFAWNSSNYIDGAVLFNPENELAKFAKELSDLNIFFCRNAFCSFVAFFMFYGAEHYIFGSVIGIYKLKSIGGVSFGFEELKSHSVGSGIAELLSEHGIFGDKFELGAGKLVVELVVTAGGREDDGCLPLGCLL